jgi:tetratricopeptide (TPR) repeat protein
LAAVIGAGLGVTLGVTTALKGEYLSVSLLKEASANASIHRAVLGIWCLILQVPWCVAAAVLAKRVTARELGVGASWPALVVSLILAAAVPAGYFDWVIERESRKAEQLLKNQRWAKALPIVGQLWWVGSMRALDGKLPSEVLSELALKMCHTATPYADNPTDQERLEQAEHLGSVGRYDEAIELLIHAAGRDPQIALVCARLYAEQEKWKESEEYCRLALRLLEKLPRTEASLTGWIKAYDGLAALAYEQNRYDQARAIYEEALRRVTPKPAQAHFHFELGRLHEKAGRPARALHHFQQAIDLDPEQYGERARGVMNEIRLHTYGCLLRWQWP